MFAKTGIKKSGIYIINIMQGVEVFRFKKEAE